MSAAHHWPLHCRLTALATHKVIDGHVENSEFNYMLSLGWCKKRALPGETGMARYTVTPRGNSAAESIDWPTRGFSK